MLKFSYVPEVSAKWQQGAFVQTVIAQRDGQEIATAKWMAPPNGDLAQLLRIDVAESRRRSGVGSELLLGIYAQAHKLSRARSEPIRRFWCVVEHERDILGRSFLFKHGYHHLTTPKNLFRGGQDAMIYVKAFD